VRASLRPSAARLGGARWAWVVVAAAAALAACGGGGGGDAPAQGSVEPLPATPSSGTYAWLIKAEGSTASVDSSKKGLSLVHPQQRDIEVVVEPAGTVVTDVKTLMAGRVDAAAPRIDALEPAALLYVLGGDVRHLPLRANGTAPAQRVQRAGTRSACLFVLDGVDHAQPQNSRFIVSTAGTDGQCGSADDGFAEVRLDASLGPVLSPWPGAAPLALLRGPGNLAPLGWLTPTELRSWDGSVTPLRVQAEAWTRALHTTARTVLLESAAGLSVLELRDDAPPGVRSVVGLVGTGWQPLGFDAQHHFVFRNEGSAAAPTWTVARIDRVSLSTTPMASGAGRVLLSAFGQDVMYLSIADLEAFELRRLPKAVPGVSQILERGASSANQTSYYQVLASAHGTHLLWRVTGAAGAALRSRVDLIDEAGRVLYEGLDGHSLGAAPPTVLDLQRSENRSRFVFVENFGPRLFGDTALVSYDAAARAATRLGSLPGRAAFGDDLVFGTLFASPLAFEAGFASRSVAGLIQAAGTRVFTVDSTRANSLVFATRVQQ